MCCSNTLQQANNLFYIGQPERSHKPQESRVQIILFPKFIGAVLTWTSVAGTVGAVVPPTKPILYCLQCDQEPQKNNHNDTINTRKPETLLSNTSLKVKRRRVARSKVKM